MDFPFNKNRPVNQRPIYIAGIGHHYEEFKQALHELTLTWLQMRIEVDNANPAMAMADVLGCLAAEIHNITFNLYVGRTGGDEDKAKELANVFGDELEKVINNAMKKFNEI
jgi:hypothetical protein